jgi:hypothetical protein
MQALCDNVAELVVNSEQHHVMKNLLADINAGGLASLKYQVGLKRDDRWQRAFIAGVATKTCAEKISESLLQVEEVMVFVVGHVPCGIAKADGPRVTVTLCSGVPGERNEVTLDCMDVRCNDMEPVLRSAFEAWCDLDIEFAEATTRVVVVDAKWGRKHELFKAVRYALDSII